jgi:hypothetical protein
MNLESDSRAMSKMVQSLIKIQEDILKIPDLSSKQENDIKKLQEELNILSFQTDEVKIKLALIDMMNRLN